MMERGINMFEFKDENMSNMEKIKIMMKRDDEYCMKSTIKAISFKAVEEYIEKQDNKFKKKVLNEGLSCIKGMGLSDFSYMLNFEDIYSNGGGDIFHTEEMQQLFFDGVEQMETIKEYWQDMVCYIADILKREKRLDIFLFENMYSDYSKCEKNYGYILWYLVYETIQEACYMLNDGRYSIFDGVMTI